MNDAQLHLVYRTPSGQHHHQGPLETTTLKHIRLVYEPCASSGGMRWQVRLEPLAAGRLELVACTLVHPWRIEPTDRCLVNGYQT